ncbi:choline/carnitine/betaine transport [Kineosphaera limosa]|uniref:Glycine betaine transporter n=1 Tax=Kineosphaera limosa NBRC 100340 TaxID=1184609 RepID=K6WV58_9MICO|nr:BCCT family transporter [Kineosphaera limosa]NYE02641.1 choline/carnitine/betaine transport [Kineosphaera limosa]GAB97731.1 glycine betaine transporter [Kineosphaera limosa NBRC 100340]
MTSHEPPAGQQSSEKPRDRARRLLHEASQAGNYPHGVHPALVPGVSVDDQRNDYRTDKVVFGVVAVTILGFFAWGVVSTETLSAASDAALEWVTTYFGWLFSALAAVVLLFMLIVGFTRFGRIPLGLDGEKPEFSRFSWISMLFAAGMGIGLLFFGPYEPMQYYLDPPPGTVDPQTRGAMHRALIQTVFHWGPQAWAMYALVGAAVAYGAYRRGRTILMSSIFAPLLGGSRGTQGWVGRVIDIFAIIATLFGTAASLGIGALQIGRGLQLTTGVDIGSRVVLVSIVTVLTVVFITSAVSGVARGIRWLSNINTVFALSMAFFVFIVGPTLFLVNFIPSVMAGYLGHTLELLAYSASMGEAQAEFVNAWPVFYWAWWVSWSPFVGIFIARISRGRTLREFVVTVILVPSTVCLVSFSIYGGTSMFYQESGQADVGGAPNAQDSLFILLDALPMTGLTSVIVLVMLTVFFVTSADSASIVMGSLAQRGRTDPTRGVIIALGLMLASIAIVMLLIGGEGALASVQNLIIVSALPFALAMVFMMWALWKDLSTDPLIIRQRYGSAALDQSVRAGVREHGDNFALAVQPTGQGQGAGADFDSSAPAVTDWYQRTDEQGRPIDYDYETGQYVDSGTDAVAHETPGGRSVRARDGNRTRE